MLKKFLLWSLILCLAILPLSFADKDKDDDRDDDDSNSSRAEEMDDSMDDDSMDDDSFKDVSNNFYAYDAILKMRSLGVIKGYSDGTFKPTAIVSRAEFAAIMVNALQIEVAKVKTSSFVDIKSNSWATSYIEAAKPYLTGYSINGALYFRPTSPAVREDMAVAIIKALNKPVGNLASLDIFEDKNLISEALKPYVAAVVENGIMLGSQVDGKWYFNPQGELTRAETAVLLLNVINAEKIIFDTPTPPTTPPVEEYVTPALTITTQADGLLLQWNKIDHTKFVAYRVVASIVDDSPEYPDNGFLSIISDSNTTSVLIKAGDAYQGTEFTAFESGKEYYFNVTAIYQDKTIRSNIIKVILP